ncbi:MAG: hypothetical protein IKJ44_05450 [Elusimicrobiaceae bacterium]|nr:hypothetical protein [Elusimicrobiaceae bacterium]MBR3899699.1 hypothetical protein [Elusimicrobiaceae bacterium]
MLKILLKAAVLFLIVLSVYFIVHPSACSNLLAGRETGGPKVADQTQAVVEDRTSLMLGEEDGAQSSAKEGEGIFDTNTMREEEQQKYSQEEIDTAIARRYVELEREYAQSRTLGKDASREISYVVMDDFQMSPAEWDSFLSRATASDLFNKVRQNLPMTPEEVSVSK